MEWIEGNGKEFEGAGQQFAVVLPAGFEQEPSSLQLSFKVSTEEQLRDLVGRFGGITKFQSSTDGLLALYSGPVTVYVWLEGPVFEKPKPEPRGVLARLLAEAEAEEKAEAEADEEAMADA